MAVFPDLPGIKINITDLHGHKFLNSRILNASSPTNNENRNQNQNYNRVRNISHNHNRNHENEDTDSDATPRWTYQPSSWEDNEDLGTTAYLTSNSNGETDSDAAPRRYSSPRPHTAPQRDINPQDSTAPMHYYSPRPHATSPRDPNAQDSTAPRRYYSPRPYTGSPRGSKAQDAILYEQTEGHPGIMHTSIFTNQERQFRIMIEVDRSYEWTSGSLCFYLWIGGKAVGNCVVVPEDLESPDYERGEPFWMVGLGPRGGKLKFEFYPGTTINSGSVDGDRGVGMGGQIDVAVEVWRGGEVFERGGMDGGEENEEGDADFCAVEEVDERPLGVVYFERHPGDIAQQPQPHSPSQRSDETVIRNLRDLSVRKSRSTNREYEADAEIPRWEQRSESSEDDSDGDQGQKQSLGQLSDDTIVRNVRELLLRNSRLGSRAYRNGDNETPRCDQGYDAGESEGESDETPSPRTRRVSQGLDGLSLEPDRWERKTSQMRVKREREESGSYDKETTTRSEKRRRV